MRTGRKLQHPWPTTALTPEHLQMLKDVEGLIRYMLAKGGFAGDEDLAQDIRMNLMRIVQVWDPDGGKSWGSFASKMAWFRIGAEIRRRRKQPYMVPMSAYEDIYADTGRPKPHHKNMVTEQEPISDRHQLDLTVLPTKMGRAVELILSGLSVKEVSVQMNCVESLTRVRLQQSVIRIRKSLAKKEQERWLNRTAQLLT